MSPLSIPGTCIQIPYPSGKTRCKTCGRDYNQPKIKRDGNFLTLHCPSCKAVVKTLSYKALAAGHLKELQQSPKKMISHKKEKQIFLSYAREDYPKAKEIYEKLIANGYNVWMDKITLLPGQKWEEQIKQAIKSSDYFIVCLSSCCVSRRGFIHKEIKFALETLEEMPPEKIYFIPIRLDQCEIPPFLQSLHWVDLDSDDVYKKLFMALEKN